MDEWGDVMLRTNAGYVMVEPLAVKYKLVTPYDKRELNRGRVVGVGTIRDQKGRVVRLGIQAGDVVVYEPFVGYEYKEYLFIPYEYVFGKVEETSNDKGQNLQNG